MRSLFGKISLIFILLITVLGIIQFLLSVRSSIDFSCESDQRLNQQLAKNLATRYEQVLSDSLPPSAIQMMIEEWKILNPGIEIYVLDQEGKVLNCFCDSSKIVRQKVDLQPLMAFLNPLRIQPLPIMGDDPRSLSKQKIFSVAPLKDGKDDIGFLYVIIGSELYDSIISSLKGSYILSTTAVALLITLIFAVFVGLLLFFLLTRRLRRMTEIVQEFEEGHLKKRVQVKSDDEVGRLAMAFNTMADRIEIQLNQLKNNDDLRREFVASVSHDLRSPLASIQGYMETIIIKDGQLSQKERQKFFKTMYHNITSLNGLVGQLFELSKLDHMETKPEIEPFPIGELVQDVVLKFQPQAEERHVNLLTKIPLRLPLVEGDIGMIDRVLSNLIDNAIRYTEIRGRICVEVQAKGPFVRIVVQDTGQGIPAEDIPYIFDRFYRVEKSRSRISGGSGLGLAIVKKILDAHGSRIKVRSKLDTGTTFTFFLRKH